MIMKLERSVEAASLTGNIMIYIESKSRNPYFNLALEEYIFERFDRSQEYFILWQNANTIVVGKYQNTAEEINQEFVDKNQIKVVRRLSGGGAVYHDDGNLNFTYIVDQKDRDLFNFEAFTEPVIKTLSKFGLEAEFTGRNDILLAGKKISGSSQYIKKSRILNHGCIMLDSNVANVAEALKPKDAKFESKSVKSVRSRVTTINANLPQPISMETFKKELIDHIRHREGVQEYTLTDDDYKAIEKLKSEKYATWEWNYGRSIAYNYQREHKYDFGLVSVNAEINHGIIEEMEIFGDFFGNGDIKELENSLVGEKLDDEFSLRIEKKLDIEHYINGMTANDLENLLR